MNKVTVSKLIIGWFPDVPNLLGYSTLSPTQKCLLDCPIDSLHKVFSYYMPLKLTLDHA